MGAISGMRRHVGCEQDELAWLDVMARIVRRSIGFRGWRSRCRAARVTTS